MKYFSLLITTLFVLVNYTISAQDVMIVESDDFDDNMVNIAPVKIEGGYISLIVEHKNNSWEDPKMHPSSVFNKELNYNYVSDEGNVYLTKLDMDLKVIAQNKIKFKDAHDINVYGMFHYKGKTSLYYTQRKGFSNEVHLFCMDIDNDKLKRNKARKIHTIKHKDGVPATRMIMSPDSTKLAFISEKHAGNKDERKLDIALFDIEGTPIWSDPVYLGGDTEKLTVSDAAVDNTGNIFVSYKVFDRYSNEESKKNKKGDRIPAYETRVITFGIDETEAYVTISHQNLFIRDCNLIYNPIQDKVQAVGTYSIKDGGNLSGTFVSNIDPVAMTAEETTFNKFDEKLIRLIDEDGFGQTKDKDPGIEIRTVETNIHFKNNGDLVYILQPYKYEERFVNNSFRNNSMRNIESGYDIYSAIVAQISNSNNNVIYTRIPRRSNSISKYGVLIAKTLVRNDQVYLLYTDHYKNLERRDDERPRSMGNPSNSSLILTNIYSTGEYNRSFLKNRDEEENFSLSMSDFHAISASEYMYTSYTGGLFSSNRYIGTVSFK